MKLDNFTTARCSNCGWIKQFHPGKEYSKKDFICKCGETSSLDKLKSKADKLGIKYPANIGEATLKKKIVEHGN